ncbi:hypothetical protein M0804_009758 [Polistes exclamans]|nr:hypothetical protein M0804_009758 [Polistes exclamans]
MTSEFRPSTRRKRNRNKREETIAFPFLGNSCFLDGCGCGCGGNGGGSERSRTPILLDLPHPRSCEKETGYWRYTGGRRFFLMEPRQVLRVASRRGPAGHGQLK